MQLRWNPWSHALQRIIRLLFAERHISHLVVSEVTSISSFFPDFPVLGVLGDGISLLLTSLTVSFLGDLASILGDDLASALGDLISLSTLEDFGVLGDLASVFAFLGDFPLLGDFISFLEGDLDLGLLLLVVVVVVIIGPRLGGTFFAFSMKIN
jgi:hypothetical protein